MNSYKSPGQIRIDALCNYAWLAYELEKEEMSWELIFWAFFPGKVYMQLNLSEFPIINWEKYV